MKPKFLLCLKSLESTNNYTVNFSYLLLRPVSTRPPLSSRATFSYCVLSTPYLLRASYKEIISPRPPVCHFARLLSNWENFHSPVDPLTPVSNPNYCSRSHGPPRILRPRSSQPSLGSPIPDKRWGLGAPVPPQLFKVSTGPTLLRPASPRLPRSPPPSDSRLSQESPQPPLCLSSTPLAQTQAAHCHPGPRPPSVSLLPRTRATPSFPAPQLPPLGPLLGFPGSSALFPRTPAVLGVYPRVTRSSDQVVAGHPGSSPLSGTPSAPVSSGNLPLTHRPPVSAQAAGRPKGPPGTNRLGLAPAYVANANSAAGNRAILPPAQSERTRRSRRRRRPGPGPTRPTVQAPFLRPPPPELRAGVSAPRRPPDLRPALPALTCRCPQPTPAPLPLPRPPVAIKRHHLPHDNRPTPFHSSYLSIG